MRLLASILIWISTLRGLQRLTGTLGVNAYIPAYPTNSSQQAIAGGLNVSDVSRLDMLWYSQGSYSQYVSYQLVGNGSTGVSRGALVHFSENMVDEGDPGTGTPWIALISCDNNTTDTSETVDIFTLAKAKGAVAALLYTLSSLGCVISPEYYESYYRDRAAAQNTNFDVFLTQSLTSAHLIDYQFGQIVRSSANLSIPLVNYDSHRLDELEESVTRSIETGRAVEAGYLVVTLKAYNVTPSDSENAAGGSGGRSETNRAGESRLESQRLDLSIRLAIIGCLSAIMFGL